MVAAHGKIFILGGEANAQSGIALDDPTAVHVLDTGASLFSRLWHVPDICSQNQVPRR